MRHIVAITSLLLCVGWTQHQQSNNALLMSLHKAAPDEYPGLVLWLEAELDSMVISNNLVTTWSDLSGYGNDATLVGNTAGIGAPKISTNTANNIVSVEFGSGGQTQLSLPQLAPADTNQSFTVVAVIRATGEQQPVNGGHILGNNVLGFGAGMRVLLGGSGTATTTRVVYRGSDNAIYNTGDHVVSDRINVVFATLESSTLKYELYLDGTLMSTTNTLAPPRFNTTANAWKIGRSVETGFTALKAHVHALMYYTNSLTAHNVEQLSRYLAEKYK
jgi:hypothetical protein